MDYYKALYADLCEKLEKKIPFAAYPVRGIVKMFRDNGNPITLKTPLTITAVYNTGDMSGILCTISQHINEKDDAGIVYSLSHLIFTPDFPLYKDVIDYQKKRAKRVEQLNRM